MDGKLPRRILGAVGGMLNICMRCHGMVRCRLLDSRASECVWTLAFALYVPLSPSCSAFTPLHPELILPTHHELILTTTSTIAYTDNYPEPGKRSLSSTTPMILEYPDGSFYTAIGGSGGSKIFPAVFQVCSLSPGLLLIIPHSP